MPDLKSIRPFQKQKFPDKGLIYPWVQDIRALPETAPGKQKWISILKNNHSSASIAAKTFGLNGISGWDELAEVTDWPVQPANVSLALKDAEDMFTAIAEQWYRLHHDTIKKYDPNHLIIGDKHDVGYDKSVHMIPDGVLRAIGKYTDVLMIQSYTRYADHHRKMLEELHQKSGLPIINGDHSYSCMNENQVKTKGIKLESQEAVAAAYRDYMKSTMENHGYMLGWWHCGYIEQWAPAGTQLGQHCGFFTPFGEPRTDLLPSVKYANLNAVKWHGGESTNEPLPAWKTKPASKSKRDQPQAKKSAAGTVAEMFASLKLTTEQQAEFEEQEKEHKAAQAKFRELNGEALRSAQDAFYAEREKKLRKIFTEEQWAIWSSFWSRPKPATNP